MWFGSMGGVAGYDGITWTSLDTRDGLVDNTVRNIYQDSDGALWFWTQKGATRYRRSTSRPGIRIVSVRTNQRYTDLSAIPPITTGALVTIEYNAIDFKTLLESRILFRQATSDTTSDRTTIQSLHRRKSRRR